MPSIPQSHTDLSLDSSDPYAPNDLQNPPMSPRSSGPPSPSTPRQQDVPSVNGFNRLSGDYSLSTVADTAIGESSGLGDGGGGGGGGLGNLADELADAWEEEEENDGYGYASGIENAPAESHQGDGEGDEGSYIERTNTQAQPSGNDASLSPEHALNQLHPKQRSRNGHNRYRRQESSYDGSDYGNDSDLEEAADISPSLEGQMAEIESLARRGLENNGSESDHVIARTVEGLKELGQQSTIENSAMRFVS